MVQVTILDEDLKRIIKEVVKEVVEEPEITQPQTVNLGEIIQAKNLLGVPIFPFAIYDYKTAAFHLDVSVSSIRRAVDNGRLQGGKNKVTERGLLRWVERFGTSTGRCTSDVEAECLKALSAVARKSPTQAKLTKKGGKK